MRLTWKGAGTIVLITIMLLLPSGTRAEDWKKYENAYFVAYSHTREERVREVLRELELFRAATLQVFSIRAPDDAPKTLVVIANGIREYEKFGAPPRSGGYARTEGDRTIFVMPGRWVNDYSLKTVRHEYAHALLAYDGFRYPQWYAEGFAELAAAIEIDEEDRAFVFGLPPEGFYMGNWDVAINWNELIDDDFNAYTRVKMRYVHAAYDQSWLLMHYLSLGPDPENAKRLAIYVSDIKNGTSSVEAFRNAFGKTPDELWETEMDGYLNRLPYYTLRFRGLTLDSKFDISAAPADELEPLLEYLQLPTIAREANRIKNLPETNYEGYWSPLTFNSRCGSLIRVEFDTATATFAFEWPGDEPEEPGTVDHYTFEGGRGGSLLLTRTEEREDSEDLQAFLLSMREGEIMCLTRADDRPSDCAAAFVLCPEPADHAASSATPP